MLTRVSRTLTFTRRRRIGKVLLLSFALFGAAVPAFAQQTQPLDATQIFRRAVERLSSYPDPLYIVSADIWSTQATRRESGEVSLTKQEQRFAFRTSDSMEYSSGRPQDKHLPPALILHEFVGPNAWSMHAVHVTGTFTKSQMAPDVAGLKTIVTVKAVAPPAYRSEMLGTESLDGHGVYHLRLTPQSDPGKHNLHELWVDTATYDVRKASFSGTYQPGPNAPASQSDVVATFTAVGPYWLVSDQIWTYAPISGSARFRFENKTTRFAFPQSIPDWIFDQGAYDKHQRAGEPDILDPMLEGNT